MNRKNLFNPFIMQKIILILGFALLSGKELWAQKNKTVVTHTLFVKGNCGQCKERIEEAADLKGVKYATWDKKSKILTVTYDTTKLQLSQIREKILRVGHDVDSLVAPEEVYRKLPSCCKYRTTTCEE
jgi:copper chaperone CopZ